MTISNFKFKGCRPNLSEFKRCLFAMPTELQRYGGGIEKSHKIIHVSRNHSVDSQFHELTHAIRGQLDVPPRTYNVKTKLLQIYLSPGLSHNLWSACPLPFTLIGCNLSSNGGTLFQFQLQRRSAAAIESIDGHGKSIEPTDMNRNRFVYCHHLTPEIIPST